jgi:hypothetical protein
MKTKKILVAFDPARPKAQSGDFAIPVIVDGRVQLVGLRSGTTLSLGMMVYLGKEITVNDVFAKLVDSGRKVPSVDQTVKMIGDYLAMLQGHKIGNVIKLESAPDLPEGFRLTRVASSPSGATGAME